MLRFSVSILVGLALSGCSAQNSSEDVSSDTFFYGQVPPVYPTREPFVYVQTVITQWLTLDTLGTAELEESGPWAEAVTKAKALVAQMTLEEKISLTGGTTVDNGCSGFIPGIDRLGFPGLCLADAGNGVRATDYVSAWPSGLHVGASWNRELAYQRANAMGKEARIKGVNVLLGPMLGALGRVVQGGRNWEGFSVDPYLTGELVYDTIVGIQDAGVIASAKHFIAQEQETHRVSSWALTQTGHLVEAVSSNVDDKTMHEAYLWPFYNAARAGTGSVMCSLQRVNNSYACQNSKAQNGLLKGELGFPGWIVSDWGGQHSGVASALGGLDVVMPSGADYWDGNLTLAIVNGSVPETRLDDMITRVLASWYQFGQDQSDFPTPGYGMASDLLAPHEVVDARDPAARPILLAGAVEGHVLVKNTDGALPLQSADMRLISIFGYSAHAPRRNNYEGATDDLLFVPWSIGAQSANATEVSLGWFGNFSINYSAAAVNGTLISGGGSGAAAWSLFSSPFDALVSRAEEDGTALFWNLESGSPHVNPTSDACIVVGNAWASEGYDRPALRDDFTDDLVLSVASQCANTIVVLHNAGTRLVDAFADHPNVTAIIFAHLPGQASGKALISLLYGDENFSGRLPYTVAYNESDYGDLLLPDKTVYPDPYWQFPQSNFTEGVYLDYRHFDALDITPRYAFGFGLSYTTFDYSGLAITRLVDSIATYPTAAVQPGGQADLWDNIATVCATITNTGTRAGSEVAQLYVGIPGDDTPVRQLRGFSKPSIESQASVTVSFNLTRRDLSVWDVTAQKWKLQTGDYTIYVGKNSRELPLVGTLTL